MAPCSLIFFIVTHYFIIQMSLEPIVLIKNQNKQIKKQIKLKKKKERKTKTICY